MCKVRLGMGCKSNPSGGVSIMQVLQVEREMKTLKEQEEDGIIVFVSIDLADVTIIGAMVMNKIHPGKS